MSVFSQQEGRMSRIIRFIASYFLSVLFLLSACQNSESTVLTDSIATVSATPAISTPSELLQIESSGCEYGGTIKAIKAVNDLTIQFDLCEPDGSFLYKLASTSLGIQSAAHLQATGGAPLRDTVGTGPYTLTEWSEGEQLTLSANPRYWGDPPKTKTLVFTWLPEAAGRLLSLQAGDVDGIDDPDPDAYSRIKADSNLQLIARPSFNIFYIALPNTSPPLDDARVRHALAIGIDRQAIVDNFFPDGSTVADYLAPCEVEGGCVGTPWPSYDPERAKKLLEEAGFPNGFETKLSYRDVTRAYLPSPTHVATEIQSELRKIGVRVVLDVQESSTFVENSVNGSLGMHLLGYTGTYLDQRSFVDVFFGRNADQSMGNHWPDLEDAIATAGSLADRGQRNELYAKVNDLIVDYAPFIPVAHSASAIAANSSVQGLQVSMLALEEFQYVYSDGEDMLVWQQNLEPVSLYCNDWADRETMRLCSQIFDSLMAYTPNGTGIEPGLAEACNVSESGLTWTCELRDGIEFSDGTPLTANDVVTTFVVEWDAAHPLHVGSSALFYDWQMMFGHFLNETPDTD